MFDCVDRIPLKSGLNRSLFVHSKHFDGIVIFLILENGSTMDYIFFHLTPYQAFMEFLLDHGITFRQANQYQASTEENALVVVIDEELDDELLEKVEDYYDQMMDLNSQLVSAQDEHELSVAGIAVNLKDGRMVMAKIDPDLVYKVSSVLSQDEIRTLVSAVVDAVDNPDERPLCHTDQ